MVLGGCWAGQSFLWGRVSKFQCGVSKLQNHVLHDRFTERRLYQDVGIPLYWIVDPEGRSVEVWTPSATFPVVTRERVVWEPKGVNARCVVELKGLFEPL